MLHNFLLLGLRPITFRASAAHAFHHTSSARFPSTTMVSRAAHYAWWGCGKKSICLMLEWEAGNWASSSVSPIHCLAARRCLCWPAFS